MRTWLLEIEARRPSAGDGLGSNETLGFEELEDLGDRLLDELLAGVDDDLRGLGGLVGVADAGEVLDEARAGLRVEALGVALLDDLDTNPVTTELLELAEQEPGDASAYSELLDSLTTLRDKARKAGSQAVINYNGYEPDAPEAANVLVEKAAA